MRFLLLCAALAVAPSVRAADLPSAEVQEKAFGEFRNHLASQSYFLGLRSEEAPKIKLGRCVRVYAVTLADLSRFGAEDSPNVLLKDAGIATCDIVNEYGPRAWIEFKKENGSWFARWYGGVGLARSLELVRQGWNEEQKAASFVVLIPGVGIQFAALAEGGADPNLNEPGQEIELKAAFNWVGRPNRRMIALVERLSQGQTRATDIFKTLGPEAANALVK